MSVHEHILTLPQQRASASLSRLVNAYNAGELTHESGLLEKLTDEFSALYSGLLDPLITPEKMRVDDLLRLSAIQKPMEQLDQDLTSDFEELTRLRNAVIAMSNVCSTERYGLDSLLSTARGALVEAIAWTANSDKIVLWNTDTFQTSNKINTNLSTTFVNTKLGIVTLEVTGQQSLADKVSGITVQHVPPKSTYVTGMAGNNLEISNSSSTSTVNSGSIYSSGTMDISEPTTLDFVGSQESTSNPAFMFDSNTNTRFEWEKYLVPDVQQLTAKGTAWVASEATTGESKSIFGLAATEEKLKSESSGGVTSGYGWTYSIKWVGEPDKDISQHWVVKPTAESKAPTTDPLNMVMDIKFSDPQDLSWIELMPYIHTGVDNTLLKSVQVSRDGTNWETLISDKNKIYLVSNLDQPVNNTGDGIPVKDYQGVAVVPCPITHVQYMRLEMEQRTPYETTIGHQYYVKTVEQTRTKSTLGIKTSKSTSKYTVRTENPSLLSTTTSGQTGAGPTVAAASLGIGGGLAGFGVISGAAIPIVGLAAIALYGIASAFSKTKTETKDLSIATYYDTFKTYRYCIGIRELSLNKRTFAETSTLVSTAHMFSKPINAATLIVSEIIPDGWDTTQNWITYELSHDGVTWQTVKPLNTDGSVGSVVQFPVTNRLFLKSTLKRPQDRPTESPVLEYYAIEAIPEGTV